MSMSQEEIDLEAKRLEVVHKIDELKKEAKSYKDAREAITRRRNLEHKLGALSEDDKAALKAMM